MIQTKHIKTALRLFLMVMLGVSLILGGCSAAKKPATPMPTKPATPTQNNTKQVADRVTTEAQNIQEVRAATAVVSGKNIFIGLDLTPGIEMNRRSEVETSVLNRIKKMEPTYTIRVTSDVDTVTRIKRVSQGITQGKPLSSFQTELREIGDRLTPKTK